MGTKREKAFYVFAANFGIYTTRAYVSHEQTSCSIQLDLPEGQLHEQRIRHLPVMCKSSPDSFKDRVAGGRWPTSIWSGRNAGGIRGDIKSVAIVATALVQRARTAYFIAYYSFSVLQ